MTDCQAFARGGQGRKDSKGELVISADTFRKTETDDARGRKRSDRFHPTFRERD